MKRVDRPMDQCVFLSFGSVIRVGREHGKIPWKNQSNLYFEYGIVDYSNYIAEIELRPKSSAGANSETFYSALRSICLGASPIIRVSIIESFERFAFHLPVRQMRTASSVFSFFSFSYRV